MNKWRKPLLAGLLGIALASPMWYPAARDRVATSQSLKGQVGLVQENIAGQVTFGPFPQNEKLWQHQNLPGCTCGIYEGNRVTAIAEDSESVLVRIETKYPVPTPVDSTYFSITVLSRLQFVRMVRAAANQPSAEESLRGRAEKERLELEAQWHRRMEEWKRSEIRARNLIRNL